jgi:leucine-rich repeat protein SHOC2
VKCKYNTLIIVVFRYNRLTCVPASLANCTLMDEFNVEGNNISTLPVSRNAHMIEIDSQF